MLVDELISVKLTRLNGIRVLAFVLELSIHYRVAVDRFDVLHCRRGFRGRHHRKPSSALFEIVFAVADAQVAV